VIGIGLSPAAAANGLLVSQESVARTSLTVNKAPTAAPMLKNTSKGSVLGRTRNMRLIYTSHCVECGVATNLLIDDALLNEAKELGGFRTKRETVDRALREFVQRHKRLEVLNLRGLIEFDSEYDHKAARKKR
jgi:Arc/MetJ family transcription regulator